MRGVDLVGIGLHVGDEFLQILRREILAGKDQDRRAREQRDGFEIFSG